MSTVDMQDDALESRVYEIGYLVVPTIAEEKVPDKVDEIRGIVEGASGRIISEGSPSLLDLAYPMSTVIANKRETYEKGYFGWVKFDAEPVSSADIKNKLDANSDIIRYILIKTVREDTMTMPAAPRIVETVVDSNAVEKRSVVEVAPTTPKVAAKKDDVKETKESSKEGVKLSSEEIDETIDKLVID